MRINYTHNIIFFSNPKFKGSSLVLFNGVESFAKGGEHWNKIAKSIFVVKGSWKIGDAEKYNGKSMQLTDVKRAYDESDLAAFSGNVSSLWRD